MQRVLEIYLGSIFLTFCVTRLMVFSVSEEQVAMEDGRGSPTGTGEARSCCISKYHMSPSIDWFIVVTGYIIKTEKQRFIKMIPKHYANTLYTN